MYATSLKHTDSVICRYYLITNLFNLCIVNWVSLIVIVNGCKVLVSYEVNYLINKEGSSFAGLTIVENALTTQDEYYSIAFRKGSDVTAKVNAILKDLKADGTVDTLAKKYGLVDAIVD